MDSTRIAVGAGLLLILAVGALVASSGDSAYETRIASLEAETALLQTRIADLEKRGGRRGRRGMTATDDEPGASPRGRGRARRQGQGGSGGGAEWDRAERPRERSSDLAAALETGDPAVRAKVQDLVREEMETAEEARWERRRERRAERIEQALTEFAEARSLSPAEQEKLTSLWSNEREQISELFRKAREDMSFGTAREGADRIRDETDTAARSLMSEEDYAAWVVLREEENPRRR